MASALGFGLMGEGGNFSGPVSLARSRDPRYAYIQALTGNALDTTTPVYSNLQGFGKLAQAAIGAYANNKLESEYKNQEDDYQRTLANALMQGQGKPAETKTYSTPDDAGNPTTINWNPVAPNPGAMSQTLASNRYTAPMALQMQIQQMTMQAKAQQDYINDLRGKGLMPNPAGGVMPIPNYGQSVGGVKADELSALSPAEAAAAAQKTAAVKGAELPFIRPAAEAQAGGAAAGALPYAGPEAQAKAAGTLAANNTLVWVQGPNGPIQVPAVAAPDIAKAGPVAGAQANAALPADLAKIAAQGANASLPTGYERTPDGGARPISGTKQATDAADDARAKTESIVSTDRMIRSIDELSSHPGLSGAVGFNMGQKYIPGTDAASFSVRLETLKSQAFLPMVAQLKGMGQLSDAEGKKLTAAIGALDERMSEKEFKSSLAEIKGDLQAARQRMGAPQGSMVAPRPSAGEIKFLGFE